LVCCFITTLLFHYQPTFRKYGALQLKQNGSSLQVATSKLIIIYVVICSRPSVTMWLAYLWLCLVVIQPIHTSNWRRMKPPDVSSTHSYLLKSLVVCLNQDLMTISSRLQRLASCITEKWERSLNTNPTPRKIWRWQRGFFPSTNVLFRIKAKEKQKEFSYLIVAPTLLKVNATFLKFHLPNSSSDCFPERLTVVSK